MAKVPLLDGFKYRRMSTRYRLHHRVLREVSLLALGHPGSFWLWRGTAEENQRHLGTTKPPGELGSCRLAVYSGARRGIWCGGKGSPSIGSKVECDAVEEAPLQVPSFPHLHPRLNSGPQAVSSSCCCYCFLLGSWPPPRPPPVPVQTALSPLLLPLPSLIPREASNLEKVQGRERGYRETKGCDCAAAESGPLASPRQRAFPGLRQSTSPGPASDHAVLPGLSDCNSIIQAVPPPHLPPAEAPVWVLWMNQPLCPDLCRCPSPGSSWG